MNADHDERKEWGKRITEFNFNGDDNKENRYTKGWRAKSTQYIGANHFDTGTMLIVEMNEDMDNINAWDCTDIAQLQGRLDSYSDASRIDDHWNIPYSILRTMEHRGLNCVMCAIVGNKAILGILLIKWSSISPVVTANNIAYKRVELCGGGTLHKPIPLNTINSDIPQTILKLPQTILGRCKHNVMFDSNLRHVLGYVISSLQMFMCGDWKWNFEMKGLKGASSNYRCIGCLSQKADQCLSPSPETRHWPSRELPGALAGAIACQTGIDAEKNKGHKYFPLLLCGYENVMMPTLHSNVGPIHNVFIILRRIISQTSPQAEQQIVQYQEHCVNLQSIATQIDSLQTSIDFLSNDANHKLLEDEFLLQIDAHRDKLSQDLNDLRVTLVNGKRLKATMYNELTNANHTLRFLNLCEQCHIKPWHIKGGSMVGIAAKNFLKYQDRFLDELRSVDVDCWRWCNPLLKRMKFWCSVTWTKHKDLFNDDLLRQLKWNLIEIDFLYHNVIHEYGGGRGHRYGIKIHGWYHIFEFCEGKRFPPAEMDDQRVEAWNLYIAQFAPIFECFGGIKNLTKLMHKLWRMFVMDWNANNCNLVFNGNKMI